MLQQHYWPYKYLCKDSINIFVLTTEAKKLLWATIIVIWNVTSTMNINNTLDKASLKKLILSFQFTPSPPKHRKHYIKKQQRSTWLLQRAASVCINGIPEVLCTSLSCEAEVITMLTQLPMNQTTGFNQLRRRVILIWRAAKRPVIDTFWSLGCNKRGDWKQADG